MKVCFVKLWNRAVLVTALAGLLLSSGCGGGGDMGMTPPLTNPVAYQIAGVNDVPKTNNDANPDYPVIGNNFVERGTNHPLVVNYSCSAPLPTQLDVLTTAGVGFGEEHDIMSTTAKNVTIQETKGTTIPAGRITITGNNCVPGSYNVTIKKDAYLNSQVSQGQGASFTLNTF